jgi:acetylornithine aminotransferase
MSIQERESTYLFHTYKRLPLEIDRGEGVYLYTNEGKKYLDMFGGLAVNALGYGHPKVLEAIQVQSRKYIHLSNYFLQEPQMALAELLIKHSGFKKLFFSNSGTESIEGAIKLARKWGSTRGKTDIYSFSNAFHGRTFGALSLMDKPKYRDGYEPFLPNCHVIEFNDVAALRKTVNEKTAAVLLEFIQGEGGITLASRELVDELRTLQQKYDFLIIADEIQAGIGRTGTFFGFQHFNVQPDIVTVAKPLGGGLPLGAIIGNSRVAEVFEPGVHGTTFGGNPVACAAGVVVLQELMNNGVMKNAEAMGNILMKKLQELGKEFPALVKEVRGYGLMIGVELHRDGEQITKQLRDNGVLVNCTNVNVLRFLPPLIINESHITEAITQLRTVFKETV